jgi:hypothetical protein
VGGEVGGHASARGRRRLAGASNFPPVSLPTRILRAYLPSFMRRKEGKARQRGDDVGVSRAGRLAPGVGGEVAPFAVRPPSPAQTLRFWIVTTFCARWNMIKEET